MKGRQTGLMPGNEDRVGYWLTPPDLMAQIQAEFDFDFDACPYPRPAGFDGLKEPWGKRVWVNPPFVRSNLSAWARQAAAQRSLGSTVVMIAPVPSYIPFLIDSEAEIRSVGYVRWYNPKGQQRERGGWPFCLFILRPP